MIISILLLSSCASRLGTMGAGQYLVKPSDTLYSIAWRYDVDFKTLALWNDIQAPYLIRPGQFIYLQQTREHLSQKPIKNATKKLIHKPIKKVQKSEKLPINWVWPVKGTQLNKFSFNDITKRGIDIASKVRQPIVAVASGKVVYSGNGLDGYKNLIIIKHNEIYLSAYAQNKNLLVKEGSIVKKGQKIADMGSSTKSSYLLHFQIRKNGKQVDPLQYLPK